MSEQSERIPHPLFIREIRPLRNWHEWLERWVTARGIEELIGLLHVGFEVPSGQYRYDEPDYGYVDKLQFYFAVADGWDELHREERPEDERAEHWFGQNEYGHPVKCSTRALRKLVAEKAFSVLAKTFFRKERYSGEHEDISPDWESYIVQEPLFCSIQDFFRPKGHVTDGLRFRNLPLGWHREPSHNEKWAIDFLRRLAEFMWRWKNRSSWRSEDEKYNASMRVRIDTAKPWMVGILAHVGAFDLLNRFIFDLDEASVERLMAIALSVELYGPHLPVTVRRRAGTLEEACYAGSKVGLFLKRREIALREAGRLRLLKEAERVRADAEERVRKLTAK